MHDDDDDDVIVCNMKYDTMMWSIYILCTIMIYDDDDINNGLTLVWLYYLLIHYSMISNLVIPYK